MAIIHILGAGITGLWQAYLLQQRGHTVSLWDPAGFPPKRSPSYMAGAMLAPYCEGEAGHKLVRDLGIESLKIWKQHYQDIAIQGTLVLASRRDTPELQRFSSITQGHRWLDAHDLQQLEPVLSDRYMTGLFYAEEAHVEPACVFDSLIDRLQTQGASLYSHAYDGAVSKADWVIDCRGLDAKDYLKTLRGVRGERLLIKTTDIDLKRPVRFLHPRIPFYIVPWTQHRFMIGATIVESDDKGTPVVRSILELLSTAYALHPLFGEARILEITAGVRPAFVDNIPKIIVGDRKIYVNGLYRHGFLLSPILAQLTADYIEEGQMRDGVTFGDHGEW